MLLRLGAFAGATKLPHLEGRIRGGLRICCEIGD